jgi:hypothetical protein
MRIFLLATFSLACLSTKAQLQLGIQGGYNQPWFSPTTSINTNYTYTTSPFRGFQVGIYAEKKLSRNWLLRSGLLIDGKGTRLKRTSSFDTTSRFIELHYLEVPVSFVRQWKVGKRLFAFVGAGGYVATAIRGVEKGEGKSFGGPFFIYNRVEFHSQNPESDGKPTVINPFDYGYKLLAGIERGSIQVLLSYSQGLQRIFPKSLVFEEKFTTRTLSLSATYLFGTKR